MKILISLFKKIVFVTTCILLIGLSSCKSDWERTPPTQPPAESMSMDFSFFENDKSIETIPTYFNWVGASATVLIYQAMTTAVTAIPTLAYMESFNHTPQKTGDLSWTWSYNFNAALVNYNAELVGTYLSEKKVKWEMYVSKDGTNAYTDFLWFEGETIDTTMADWIIYENPEVPNETLRISYNRTDELSATLKYLVTKPGGNEEGSFIEFGSTNDAEFDRFYNIYKVNPDYTVEIEWNADTKEGRVKNPGFVNQWRCWDAQLQDVDCTN